MGDDAGSRRIFRRKRKRNRLVYDANLEVEGIPQPVFRAVVVDRISIRVRLRNGQLERADLAGTGKVCDLGSALPVVAGEIVKDDAHSLAVQQNAERGEKRRPPAALLFAAQRDLNTSLLEHGPSGEGFGIIQKAIRAGNVQVESFLLRVADAVIVSNGKIPVAERVVAPACGNDRNGRAVCHFLHRYASCAASTLSCRFSPGASLPTSVPPSR